MIPTRTVRRATRIRHCQESKMTRNSRCAADTSPDALTSLLGSQEFRQRSRSRVWWRQLPPRFYKDLKALAHERGLSGETIAEIERHADVLWQNPMAKSEA